MHSSRAYGPPRKAAAIERPHDSSEATAAGTIRSDRPSNRRRDRRSGCVPSGFLCEEDVGGWVGLIFYTPIVFGYVVRQYRHLWRLTPFWFTVSGLLILHLLTFTLVLRNYPVRPFWFAVISGVEIMLVNMVLDMVLPRPHQSHRRDATHGDSDEVDQHSPVMPINVPG